MRINPSLHRFASAAALAAVVLGLVGAAILMAVSDSATLQTRVLYSWVFTAGSAVLAAIAVSILSHLAGFRTVWIGLVLFSVGIIALTPWRPWSTYSPSADEEPLPWWVVEFHDESLLIGRVGIAMGSAWWFYGMMRMHWAIRVPAAIVACAATATLLPLAMLVPFTSALGASVVLFAVIGWNRPASAVEQRTAA